MKTYLGKIKWTLREGWYSFKRDLLPYPLSLIGKYGIRWILNSCTVEVKGLEYLKSHHEKNIVMIWHNRLIIMCEFFHRFLPGRPYAAFLSKSRDGEPIAKVIKRYQHGTAIRVPHNLKHQALKEAITYLNHSQGSLLITPDGPKGPLYQIKPGVLLAARQSGAPIFTVRWEADRFWELKTWDKFRLPKPFSKITIFVSEPIHLDASLSTEHSLKQLEKSMSR